MNDYETYLTQTREEIREAIREAENAGFHHESLGTTIGSRLYSRLLTWEATLTARLRIIDEHENRGETKNTLA